MQVVLARLLCIVADLISFLEAESKLTTPQLKRYVGSLQFDKSRY